MSILNIKERFSQRVQKAEEDVIEEQELAGEPIARPVIPRSLREVDVGISEYLSDLPGFNAIIKHRYSDFNVHEIDKDGKIAVLNSFDLPDESTKVESQENNVLDEDTLAKLSSLVDEKSIDSVSIDVTKNTKEERTKIHEYVKFKYGSSIISNTKDDGELKYIVVQRLENGAKDNRWPSHLPRYLHFILSKTNTDTTQALSVIGSKLRIKVSNFNIAGTKDKRANTSQWVSIKTVRASQLKSIKHLRNIWIGNFVYKHDPLALGSLRGNNFQIALRNVTASDELIENSLNQWKENGFINYFGLQRFGSCPDVPTHEIGRKLLQECYNEAVDLILKPREGDEKPDIKLARKVWANSRDPTKALNALRDSRSIEGKLLQGLKTHGPKAYVNALDSLPRNVRQLYTHAYQSLIWNKVASRRIRTMGLKVLEGDLVFLDQETVIEQDIASDETTEVVEEKPSRVKHITLEDLEKYTIYDVVLPTPGYDSVFPKNEIAEWYVELLSNDGLTVDSLKLRVKQFGVSGSFRHLLKKPKNLSWKIVRHSEADQDLILNDFDIIRGRKLEETNEGPHRSVVINLDLASSTYATMALREVLRADTSPSNQTLLKRESDEQIQNAVPEKKAKVEDC